MILEGKAKEDFQKWYCINVFESHVEKEHFNLIVEDYFYILPESMQYGVLVDFFDSVGLVISMEQDGEFFIPDINESDAGRFVYYESRPKARQKAIKKANEIYNNK